MPAWTVMVPAAASISSIARMRSMERITQVPIGTPPPASPVMPPWGTTAMVWALQNFRISETSAVERG